MSLSGLTTVNVELTSRCNKDCPMCGRRVVDRKYPELALDYGDMEFDLVESIARQLPDNVIVQFHSNGESTVYDLFGEAVSLFNRQIRCLTTNGKLLVAKSSEIIDNLDTLCVSVIEGDTEDEKREQYEVLKEFIAIKGSRKPYVTLKMLGKVDDAPYRELPGCLVFDRVLHNPMGSFKYKKKVTIPEIGICLDFLNHPCINRNGDISICVRFDPNGVGILGNLREQSLEEIWNSEKRMEWLRLHVSGKRSDVPLCEKCEFWGIPTSN